MIRNKFMVLNLIKASMVILLIFSCTSSSRADEVDSLIQKLKDKNTGVRGETANALGKIKDVRAVEPLIATLKDEDWGVRWEAADALVRIGTPAVEPLIAVLKDEDWNVRRRAADALGEIKDVRAVAPLIAALKDEDWDVRRRAVDALERICTPAVESFVRIGTPNVRIGTPNVEPLIECLTDWDLNKKVASVLAHLSTLGWKPQSDMDRIHFLVAKRNISALKEDWNTTKAVLLKDVESESYRIIENALYAFIGIGKEEIIPELIKKLNEKGNKTTAEAYLNCGRSELVKAASEWASRHGYSEMYGSGNAPVGWGSMR